MEFQSGGGCPAVLTSASLSLWSALFTVAAWQPINDWFYRFAVNSSKLTATPLVPLTHLFTQFTTTHEPQALRSVLLNQPPASNHHSTSTRKPSQKAFSPARLEGLDKLPAIGSWRASVHGKVYSPERLERLSSPDISRNGSSPTLDPHSNTDALDLFVPSDDAFDMSRDRLEPRSYSNSPLQAEQEDCPGEIGMGAKDVTSLFPEFEPAKSESNELMPVASADDNHTTRSSSDNDDDDVPLRTRRSVVREATKERESNKNTRGSRDYRETRREPKDHADRNRDRPTQHQPPKSVPKSTDKKQPKKPGPRPWAVKPIMKNDMVAKMEIIREIEGLWGKNFITAYIPKCHRPLVKRGKIGKRSVYRDHETNPKNWLPSVLKAILMIAKLTQNKNWLKKAMNDVVRYRIKNTGNRKPQLVTTDFDVIEDMLVKEWEVPFSFEIRYKHLLVNRKDQQETDEDIDHILGVGPDQTDVSGDDDDDYKAEDADDQVKMEGDGSEEEDLDYESVKGQYMDTSGRTESALYSMPEIRQQHDEKKEPTHVKHKQWCPPQEMYCYGGTGRGYGPTMDPWDRPMPGYYGPGGYSGYGMSYDDYGGPPQYAGRDFRGRQGSQQPSTRSMPQFPPYHPKGLPNNPRYRYQERSGNPFSQERFYPVSGSKHVRGRSEQTPTFDMDPQVMNAQGYSNTSQRSRQTPTKHDSPENEEYIPSPDGMDGSLNDADEEAIEAELAAAELQLKVARLRAKKSALRKQQTKNE